MEVGEIGRADLTGLIPRINSFLYCNGYVLAYRNL